MIVSSLVGNPISVLISDNVYAETVADLKALSVTNLPNSTQISVGGYYSIGDGGGGTFFYKSTSSTTDNGGTVIAPDVGSGRWIRILPSAGTLNVKWFGAKGDGTTDDTSAIATVLSTSGVRTVFFPSGHYRITAPLDLTHRFGPLSVVGEGWTYNGTGSIINPETSGGVAIDCTGSSYLAFRDISIVTFGRPNPSTVGILFGRSNNLEYEFAQFNTMRNVHINMHTDIAANGGHGTVGIYNYAAEQHDYSNIEVRADTALAFVQTNVFGISSPYRTFSTSGYSCGMLTIGGGGSTLAAKTATTYPAYLSGSLCVHFNNTYFQGSGHGDGTVNNRAIYADNVQQLHVRGGNVEEANGIAYLKNCTDVVLNVACKARSIAPVQVAASSTVVGLVFKPLVIGATPYTSWPRFIECGSGATLTDTYINVPGDDATVSGNNAADFKAYYRSMKRSTAGNGGIINQHLAGVPIVEEAVSFTSIAASGRPNGSLFLDSADGVLKFKDSGGTVHALW